MRFLPLFIKGWLFHLYIWKSIPKDSLNWRFKKSRKFLGLSQEEAAAMLGVGIDELKLFEYGHPLVMEDKSGKWAL